MGPIFCDRPYRLDGIDYCIGRIGSMGLILIMDQSLAERTTFGASSIHGQALPQLPQHHRVLRVRHLPRAQRRSMKHSINRTIRTIDQSDHSLHPPPGSQTTEDSETGSAGRGRRLEIFAPHIHRPHARNPCETGGSPVTNPKEYFWAIHSTYDVATPIGSYYPTLPLSSFFSSVFFIQLIKRHFPVALTTIFGSVFHTRRST